MLRIVTLAFAALAFGGVAQDSASIQKGIGGLRALPDAARGTRTRELALQIRALPAGPNKVGLAYGLSNLATEGDFGPGTLQAVADTLTQAVGETPTPSEAPYLQLANLARYEEIEVDLDASAYKAALAKVDAVQRERAKADFTLRDRAGRAWTRSALKGKVVIVNFWATWCPPCRKEMPDLTALQTRFKDRIVILGISDERPETVDAYLAQHPVDYPGPSRSREEGQRSLPGGRHSEEPDLRSRGQAGRPVDRHEDHGPVPQAAGEGGFGVAPARSAERPRPLQPRL